MSTIRTDTLTNAAGTKSVPVATVVDGSAKAWVNFNGTGTVAIRASFNVSSITDNGVGDYTVNFTTAMADANYSMSANAALEGNSGAYVNPFTNATYLAGSIRLRVANQVPTAYDSPNVFATIFR